MPRRLFAILCAALLPASALALPWPETQRSWTAPSQPRSGEPITLVFNASVLPDLDPATGPRFELGEDGVLHVELRIECTAFTCDYSEERAFQVELPPLATGEYQVRVWHNLRTSSPKLLEIPLTVAAYMPPPAPVPVADAQPAEGFWVVPDRPGTGLYLQLRDRHAVEGGMLGVAVLDFAADVDNPWDDGTVWLSGATPLRRSSAAIAFPWHADGSCIGCTPHAAPSETIPVEMLRLRFDSARSGWMDLADGTTLPIISLPWGAPYVDVALQDAQAAAVHPLPLPDLSGPWMLEDDRNWNAEVAEYVGSDQHPSKLLLCPPITTEDGVEFLDEDKRYTLRCRPANGSLPARCELVDYAQQGPVLAMAALGDIEEDRVRFVRSVGPLASTPFIAVRAGQDYRVDILPPPGHCNRSLD